MCISPLNLLREYNDINGSRVNVVPCGKCPECLRARANAWAFRIYTEMKHSTSAKFITLTYQEAPKSLNGLDTLCKDDCQDFMKRLRQGTENRIKYYLCGEYGTETERPHYHILLLNIPKLWTLDSKYIQEAWSIRDKNYKLQPIGHVHIGDANIKTIHYTLKYMMKGKHEAKHELDDREPVFSLMSKGMGLKYLTPEMIDFLKSGQLGYITLQGGIKAGMPKYYKDKLFTASQRKLMAKVAREQQEQNPKFKNENHAVQWKNDLIRKTNKKNLEKGTL